MVCMDVDRLYLVNLAKIDSDLPESFEIDKEISNVWIP